MPEQEAPAMGEQQDKQADQQVQQPATEEREGDVAATADKPDAVRKALDAERKARREAEQRATDAEAKVRQEFEERDQTALQKAEGRATRAAEELKAAKADNTRLHVALDKKLPPELIGRLQGSTRDEMEADAEELLKLVSPPAEQATDFDAGARSTAPEDKPPDQAHNELLLRLAGKDQP